jgi:FtsP/CotA-like multicopper oxidase with cupredoxin domain
MIPRAIECIFIVATLSAAGCTDFSQPASDQTDLPAGRFSPDFQPTLDLRLRATQATVQILEGSPTDVLTYVPEVLSGDPSRVTSLPGSYIGPIIRVRKADRLRIRLSNELDEPTIIHWHGMRVPPVMDGHPRYAIPPGDEFVYEFEIRDRAATYWFHPHAHGFTASQVYRGLAGLLLVSDEEEDSLDLPTAENDLPFVIQDRKFDAQNRLVYPPLVGMMMDGFLGDTVLVNGQADFVLSTSTRAYRLRLLNGSNSRTYKLAWNDGAPLVVIATDGGLLQEPTERAYTMLAPGQRITLWADFSKYPVGTELALESQEFMGAGFGMHMMWMGRGMFGTHMMESPAPATAQVMGHDAHDFTISAPNGAAMQIMRVRVDSQEEETQTLPETLSLLPKLAMEDAVNADSPRRFSVSVIMGMMVGMQWSFDGRMFRMNEVADHEIIPFDTLEAWEFVNDTFPVVMSHPIHIHGVQFQVSERNATPQLSGGWNSVREGYIDEGWQDTVLLMPGERVKLLIRFDDFKGEYLYHCHNLEHADAGMMRNLRVE